MSKQKYKSIHDFEIRTQLSRSSQGSYGVVVDAIRKSDQKEFVMKFFGYTKNKPDISWILREIDNLRALNAIEGVAQIEATFTDSAEGYISKMIQKKFKRKYPIIVMEKLSGGDLFDKIMTTHFSERDASIIFKTFMTALNQIHYERDMINIDLKTENLVFAGINLLVSTETANDIDTTTSLSHVTANNADVIANAVSVSINESSSAGNPIVKIIDFGMAVSLWDRHEHFEDKVVGTAAFLAPETIIHYERYGQAVYSRASDVWQAGCILYMILTAQYPFGSESTHTSQQLIHNIKNRKLTLGGGGGGSSSSGDSSSSGSTGSGSGNPNPSMGLNLSPQSMDLLSKIFELNPNKRITAKDILIHPWITENASLSVRDMGEVYKNRLKTWSCRKRFRNLVNRSSFGSRVRQQALQTILSESPSRDITAHTTATAATDAAIAAAHGDSNGNGNGNGTSFVDHFSNRSCLVRSTSSAEYASQSPAATATAASHAASAATATATAEDGDNDGVYEDTAAGGEDAHTGLYQSEVDTYIPITVAGGAGGGTGSAAAVSPVNSVTATAATTTVIHTNQKLFEINNEGIRVLKNAFVSYIVHAHVSQASVAESEPVGAVIEDSEFNRSSQGSDNVSRSDIRLCKSISANVNCLDIGSSSSSSSSSNKDYIRSTSNTSNSSSGSGNGSDSNSKESSSLFTIEHALQHNGIDYEAFHAVVLRAGFPLLATRAVFDLFDWNQSGRVDYLEFLFTLSSFRGDVDWTNPASVARLYYDIFDIQFNSSTMMMTGNGMVSTTESASATGAVVADHTTDPAACNGSGSSEGSDTSAVGAISVDLLVLVLSKLLVEGDDDITSHLLHDDSGSSGGSGRAGARADGDNDPLSTTSIFDIVQCIDTDGDGVISYKEFEAFFQVILRLKSMSTCSMSLSRA